MYRETSPSLDMRNSTGVFDVPIGAGTKIFPSAPSFKLLDAFENTGSFNCEGGGTYSPVADDKRLLRVQFFDGIGWRLISPDADIRSVPFAAQAKVAQSAHRLGTLRASIFVISPQREPLSAKQPWCLEQMCPETSRAPPPDSAAP